MRNADTRAGMLYPSADEAAAGLSSLGYARGVEVNVLIAGSGEPPTYVDTLRRRAEQYRRTVESVQQALRAPLPKLDVADAVLQRIATAPQQSSPLRPTPWHGASRSAVWLSAGVAAAPSTATSATRRCARSWTPSRR